MRLLAVITIALSILSSHLLAASPASVPPVYPSEDLPIQCANDEPYCGIYCLYVVAKLEGRSRNFEDFLQPRYFGSSKTGSSVEELTVCARDCGFHPRVFEDMDIASLKGIESAAVLHVKSSPGEAKYTHYILYLGNINGQAKVFDPAKRERLMKYSDLAPIWDGVTIVLNSDRSAGLPFPVNITVALWLGLAVTATRFLTRVGPTKRLSQNHSVKARVSGMAVVVLAAGLCGAISSLTEGGMLRNVPALNQIVSSHRTSFLPTVSFDEMVEAIHRKDSIIIDARHQQDYDAGHIPTAQSFPIGVTNPAMIRQRLAELPHSALLIIYCQGKDCPFSDALARMVMDDGFMNVQIFRGGWEEWEQKSPSFHL